MVLSSAKVPLEQVLNAISTEGTHLHVDALRAGSAVHHVDVRAEARAPTGARHRWPAGVVRVWGMRVRVRLGWMRHGPGVWREGAERFLQLGCWYDKVLKRGRERNVVSAGVHFLYAGPRAHLDPLHACMLYLSNGSAGTMYGRACMLRSGYDRIGRRQGRTWTRRGRGRMLTVPTSQQSRCCTVRVGRGCMHWVRDGSYAGMSF